MLVLQQEQGRRLVSSGWRALALALALELELALAREQGQELVQGQGLVQERELEQLLERRRRYHS